MILGLVVDLSSETWKCPAIELYSNKEKSHLRRANSPICGWAQVLFITEILPLSYEGEAENPFWKKE